MKKQLTVRRAAPLAVLLVMLAALVGILCLTASADTAAARLPAGAALWDGTVSASLSGSGTASDPYRIESEADFVYFRNTAAAAAGADTYFSLTRDLYFNDDNFKGPDGKNANNLGKATGNFAGVLDGAGHTLYNLVMNDGSWSAPKMGLFNLLTGTVRNLNVNGLDAYANNGESAAVANELKGGTLSGCRVTAATVSGKLVGGLFAKANGTALIENSAFAGTLNRASDASRAGGIVGALDWATDLDVTVRNCTADVSVNCKGGNTARVGGICGTVGIEWANKKSPAVTIDGCRANLTMVNDSGTKINASNLVGGVVGYVGQYVTAVTIEDCDVTLNGSIPGKITAIGGVVGKGENANLTLRNCRVGGAFEDTLNTVGGVVGVTNKPLTLSACVVDADLTGGTLGIAVGDAGSQLVNLNGFYSPCAGSLIGANAKTKGDADPADAFVRTGADWQVGELARYAEELEGILRDLYEDSYVTESLEWTVSGDTLVFLRESVSFDEGRSSDKVYDGLPAVIYPMASNRVTVRTEWYRLSGESTTALSAAPSVAGQYEVRLIATAGGKVVGEARQRVTISPRTVDLSALKWDYSAPFVFNTEARSVSLVLPDEVLGRILNITYTDNRFTKAGDYTAVASVTAKEPGSVTFTGALSTCPWQILKSEIRTDSIRLGGEGVIYNGQEQEIPITGLTDDQRRFLDMTFSAKPITVGTYTITVTFTLKDVPDVENYVLTGETVKTGTLVIKRAPTVVDVDDIRTVYNGKALDVVGNKNHEEGDALVREYFKDGNPVDEILNVGTYTVVFTFAGSENYEPLRKTVTVVVEPFVTVITASSDSITVRYDGQPHTIEAKLNHTAGLPVIRYVDRATGEYVDAPVGAGEYVAVITYHDAAGNHTDARYVIPITILPESGLLIRVDDSGLTYNGNPLAALISVVGAEGIRVEHYYMRDGQRIADDQVVGAGTYTLVIHAYTDDGNYDTTQEFTVTVKRAGTRLTMSGETSCVWDGGTHRITVTPNHTEGTLTLVYTKDGKVVANPSDAGEYVVTATLTGAANYEDATETYRLVIEQAEYDMSGITFPDGSFLYNGREHQLKLAGTLPAGVTVSYSGPYKKAGVYTVTATFTGDANHKAIPDMTATLYILAVSGSDENTGVKIDIPKGIGADQALTVTNPDFKRGDYKTGAFVNHSSVKRLYRITLGRDGTYSAANGKVVVYIPVEDWLSQKGLCLVWVTVDENGNRVMTEIEDVTLDSGEEYFVLELDSLDGDIAFITADSWAPTIIAASVAGVVLLGVILFLLTRFVFIPNARRNAARCKRYECGKCPMMNRDGSGEGGCCHPGDGK